MSIKTIYVQAGGGLDKIEIASSQSESRKQVRSQYAFMRAHLTIMI